MDREEKREANAPSVCSDTDGQEQKEQNTELISGQDAQAAAGQNAEEAVVQNAEEAAMQNAEEAAMQNVPDVIRENKENLSVQPTLEILEIALAKEKRKNRIRRFVRNLILVLLVIAAAAVLVTTLWMPLLRIRGTSMNPLLQENDLVMTVRTGDLNRGDLIAFYYNEKVLVKRLIGLPGDRIDIDKKGYVSVNGERLEEPYVEEISRGVCEIDLPYEVPEGRYFVLGDNREVSIDSRSREIGCIAGEQIIGKVSFRLWPFREAGGLKNG